MNKMILMALTLSLFSIQSFAKITIFSNEDALKRVLTSNEYKEIKSKSPLKGMKMYNSGVKKNGNGGIGTVFDVTLSFRAGGMSLKVCGVTARVVSQKTNPVAGITASRLSNPVFSEVRCAY